MFDDECLASCSCEFEIEELDQDELLEKVQSLNESVISLISYFEYHLAENKEKFNKALSNYFRKEKLMYTQVKILTKKHAIKTFGCDETCVNDCLNSDFLSFLQLPSCVLQCECHQNLVRFANDEVNDDSDVSNQDSESQGFLAIHQ